MSSETKLYNIILAYRYGLIDAFKFFELLREIE